MRGNIIERLLGVAVGGDGVVTVAAKMAVSGKRKYNM